VKLLATSKAEQNEAAFDPWTVVHFAAGLAAGLAGVPAPVVAAAAVGYELVENRLEQHPSAQRLFGTVGPESPANVGADLAVTAIGWWLGRRWNR
jgi:hypothetical protein